MRQRDSLPARGRERERRERNHLFKLNGKLPRPTARPPQCENSVGTVICRAMWRVAPPNTISRMREWP